MSHLNPNQHFDVESWRDRQIAQRTKDALAARDAAFAEKHADTPLRELALYLARCARTLRHSPAPCEVDGGTFTEAEAKHRKAEIEYKQGNRTFISPNKTTVSAFLDDFVSLYGVKKWSPSTYEANTGLIRNYINPLLGNVLMQDVTTIAADRFITTLQRTKCPVFKNRYSKTEYMTPANIERINKLLRCAFKQAVRWDIVAKNPFDNTTLPKVKRKPREIWDAATIRKALDECKDGRLYVAINLSFACSLRIGEIVGLTWDNIHISDADIANDNAYLCVEKELARVKESSLAVLGEEEIIKKFPRTMYLENASTVIVLKTPKTESSVRKVWMPKTVAYILREWKDSQDKQKEFLGDEYLDYNLVVALPNGRPCEETVISNAFRRLKRDVNLPNVVFHSLRHSSTTYKLKLNHGDIKATQGDTGHSQADMVTKVYGQRAACQPPYPQHRSERGNQNGQAEDHRH